MAREAPGRIEAVADALRGGAVAAGIAARSVLAPRRRPVTLRERLHHMAPSLPVRAEVLIHWDAHQIPFIEADNDDDLAVALGAVHAHLRLAQMEFLRRLAAGRVAEVVGALAVPLDRTARLFDFARAVPAIIGGLTPASRRWAEGFVAGVNRQIEAGPVPEEFRLLGIAAEPWTLHDLFTTARLASADVSWIVWSRLLRLRRKLPRAVWAELWPGLLDADGTDAEPTAAAEPIARATRMGSNAAVVGGRRSASGAGMIAADPHLSTALPNIWLAAGLSSPGINAVGLMPAGFPIMAIGRNRWLGWGGTSLHAASSDLFDASGLTLRVRETDIRVRGGRVRRVRLRESELGPIVSDGVILRDRVPLALKWVGHAPTDELGAMLGVMQARTGEEFRAALAGFAVPAQNMLYAGRDGRIGHLLAAALPARPLAPPPDLVLDPRAADAWQRMVSTADLPHWPDPDEGFAVSANDRPPDGALPVGFFFSAPDRAERMRELLAGSASITLDDLAALQADVFARGAASMRDAIMPRMRAVAGAHPAVVALAAWDGRYDAASAGALAWEALAAGLARRLAPRRRYALLAALWTGRRALMRGVVAAADPAFRTALARTLPEAARALRRSRTWGGAHRLALRHVLAPLPVLGRRYRFGNVPGAGSNETLNKTGHRLGAHRHEVTFGTSARFLADLAEPDANRVVLLGGQDGWLGSDTFLDQVPLWQRDGYIDLPLQPATARTWPHRTLHTPLRRE